MNTYLVIKWLHIVSSVLLAGTGFGSAFYLFFANRSGSIAAQAVVARLVKRADYWFTTPAVIVQPLTGVWLAMQAGWTLVAVKLLAIGVLIFFASPTAAHALANAALARGVKLEEGGEAPSKR